MIIVHTIQRKYAPTAIALGTYPHYKVKSTVINEGHSHNHESPSYKVHNHPHMDRHIYIYIHIHHAQCYHIEQKSKIDIANVPRVWPSKVQEM